MLAWSGDDATFRQCVSETGMSGDPADPAALRRQTLFKFKVPNIVIAIAKSPGVGAAGRDYINRRIPLSGFWRVFGLDSSRHSELTGRAGK